MSKSKKHIPTDSARQQVRTAHITPSSASSRTARTSNRGKEKRHMPSLPIPVITFLVVWLWAAWWQGDVFRMVHENSFFAPDETLMHFELSKPYGVLWTMGRALLTMFRHPWFGGLILSFILTAGCWLLGYAMRLKPAWRWMQYIPLGIFTGIFTYQGICNWFEAETGQVMGIPFCILLILAIWGLIIRSFSHKPAPAFLLPPKDEKPIHNLSQLIVVALSIVLPMMYAHYARPYVRPLAKMQVGVLEQDWQSVIETGKENATISNRPMAAQYAIALVQTGQIGEKLFDIRLDYDSIYAVALNGDPNSPTNLYLMECDYHAGLVETAYHHAMESMAMEGPTLRNLKMLCKTAILRSEWEVADKYLTILDKVPFEGDFVEKYRPMLNDTTLVNADKEMAMVRLTEPIYDYFENRFVQPVFLGYNASLFEGRSVNALWNSLMVHIYTKTMQEFLFRVQPLIGTTPPTSIAEALTLMSNKQPEIAKAFPNLNMYQGRLGSFINDTRQYMGSPEDRAAHAYELFPKYQGYYPYYYFFGNLKATKKSTKKESSKVGVN